jgi:hypothetical protein
MARKAVKASKLVPLEKRLGRLRKEEAKRQKQLKVVQEKAARTSEQMTRLLQSVTDRIEHSEAIAATESEPRNGIEIGRASCRERV